MIVIVVSKNIFSIVVCDALRESHSVEWIDLTACSLTSWGAAAVANIIKV